MEFHYRVDYERDDDKVREFYKKFSDIIEKFMAFHEVSAKSGKSHYHIHIHSSVELDELAINKYRKQFAKFWNVKGPSQSFTRDRGKSKIYTTKDNCRVFVVGYTDEEIAGFYSQSYEKPTEVKEKVKTKTIQENPMERMLKGFREHAERRVVEMNQQAKGTLIEYDIEDVYNDDCEIVRFVMKWYGSVIHKSFMKHKMAECANYLKYNVTTGDKRREFLNTTECDILTLMSKID